MALTSAQRQQRYRERLKNNPEKRERLRKKNLEQIRTKKKKISELTEEEKKKQREEWGKQKRRQRLNKKNEKNKKLQEKTYETNRKVLQSEKHKEAQETQPQPGPSEPPSTTTSDASRTTQDPLSTGKLEQCRFCGEFSKTCVPVARMLYLSNNKTTLAVNENIVQLDFNDVSLPNTACKECDRQLKEMYDFIQVVIDAQNNLIKIGALDAIEENIEKESTDELETVVVKTECEDDSDENRNEDTENEDDDKYIIKDPLTVDTTVFIKENVPQKRKGNTKKETAKKPKKAPTENKSEIDDFEFVIDIKEEVIERKETNEDVDSTGCSISDTGTDVKPNEVELATNALIYEMRRDSEDGFS